MHGPSILFEGKGYGLSLAAAIASDGNTVTSYEPRLPAPPLWDSIDQWGEKSFCDSQLCAFISVHIDFIRRSHSDAWRAIFSIAHYMPPPHPPYLYISLLYEDIISLFRLLSLPVTPSSHLDSSRFTLFSLHSHRRKHHAFRTLWWRRAARNNSHQPWAPSLFWCGLHPRLGKCVQHLVAGSWASWGLPIGKRLKWFYPSLFALHVNICKYTSPSLLYMVVLRHTFQENQLKFF